VFLRADRVCGATESFPDWLPQAASSTAGAAAKSSSAKVLQEINSLLGDIPNVNVRPTLPLICRPFQIPLLTSQFMSLE
jgi:hypothetical protein